MTFSFVTPAYNNPAQVKKLLDSIRPEAAKDPSLEVIVVDDCSPNEGLKKVVSESGFARYIRLDTNSGPAKARNVGGMAAKNDLIIFVDSDVILNQDTLSRIREKFSDPKVDILGGEYDLEPANPSVGTRFKSLMVASWRPRENYVTVFLTRLGVIKKDIFVKSGGFDTNLTTASVEDYEFGRRLMASGYTMYYDENITVKHHFPSFKKQVKLFFQRAFMWMYAFEKCVKFDNTCTTPTQGLSQLCGFLAILSLVLWPFNSAMGWASVVFLAIFVATNSRFFMLTLKNGGASFAILSVLMALVISCSIVLGAAWGAFYYFVYMRIKKKR